MKKTTHKVWKEKVTIYEREDIIKEPIMEKIPWINSPQYRIWVEVEWSVWNAPVIGYTTIPVWTSTGSYDITASEIWFTPKVIRIQARMDWSTPSVSDMTCDGINTWGLYTVGTSWWSFSDSRMIRVYVNASNQLWANFTEFIQWWVRVNLTHASFWASDPVECLITAWK